MKKLILMVLFATSIAFGQQGNNQSQGEKGGPPKSAEGNSGVPRTQDGKPDLSGVWGAGNAYLDVAVSDRKLPYTEAGVSAYEYNLTKVQDPQSLCVLIGEPRAVLDGQPFEIVQTPSKIAVLYERMHVWRTIPVNGKPHPADFEPSFFGDAVGTWEGDTLVVDLIGFKGEKVWTDNNAHPQSDALHIVERWTHPDADHLRAEVTFEDPKYYKTPLTITRQFKRQPYDLIESSCDENNIDRNHLGNGLGTKNGKRGFDPPTPKKGN